MPSYVVENRFFFVIFSSFFNSAVRYSYPVCYFSIDFSPEAFKGYSVIEKRLVPETSLYVNNFHPCIFKAKPLSMYRMLL